MALVPPYRSLVPGPVLTALGRADDTTRRVILEGAVLRIDLSGLNSRVHRASQEDPQALHDAIRRTMAVIADNVGPLGGTAHRYGASTQVVFPRRAAEAPTAPLQRAVAAGMAIAEASLRSAIPTRVAVAGGILHVVAMGDSSFHLVHCVVGAPVAALEHAIRYAEAGQVVAPREMAAALAGFADCSVEDQVLLIESVGAAPVQVWTAGPAEGQHTLFVPPPVRQFVDRGAGPPCLRSVVVVVAAFPAIATEDPDLSFADTFLRGLQREAARLGGLVEVPELYAGFLSFAVVFGAPEGQSHPSHAAELALRVRDRLGESARLAIVAGAAWCGWMGSAERYDYAVVGGPLSRAAGLLRDARPDQILVERGVEESLRSGFRLRLTGREEERGHAGVYELVAAHRNDGLGARGPIVGRVRLLAELRQPIEAALGGAGRVVLVCGEPGSGRAHFVQAGLAAYEEGPHRLVLGVADADSQAEPLQLWREPLRALLALPAELSGELIRAVLRPTLQSLDAPGAAWELAFAGLLGFGSLESRGDLLTPAQRARRATGLLVRLILTAARERPLVIVLEQLDQADLWSQRLVGELAARAGSAPLLILATVQSASFSLPPSELGPSSVQRIVVGPLPRETAIRLAAARLRPEPGRPEQPARITRAVHGAEGNALRLIQMIRALHDAEVEPEASAPPSSSLASADAGSVAGGDNLGLLMSGRLRHLAELPRRVIEAASVRGAAVSTRTLEAALPDADPGELVEAIGVLQQRDLLRPEAQDGWRVSHRELSSRILMFIPPATLATLHGRFADYLAAAEAPPARQVRHLVGAGRLEEAAQRALLAAAAAADWACGDVALVHLRLLAQLSADLGQDRVDPIALRHAEAQALLDAGRSAEAFHAWDLIIQGTLPAPVPGAAPRRPPLGELLARVGTARLATGQTHQAITMLEGALRSAGRWVPRRWLTAQVLAWASLARYRIQRRLYPPNPAGPARSDSGGHPWESAALRALLRAYETAGVPRTFWASTANLLSSLVTARAVDRAGAYLDWVPQLLGRGRVQEARSFVDDAQTLAETAGQPVLRALALQRRSILHLYTDEPVQGLDLAVEGAAGLEAHGEGWEAMRCLAIAANHALAASMVRRASELYAELEARASWRGAQLLVGWARGQRPWCRYVLGEIDAETARAEIAAAIELLRANGDVAATSRALAALTRIAMLEGEPERALRSAQEVAAALPGVTSEIPYFQAAWVHVGDAAIYALESDFAPSEHPRLSRLGQQAEASAHITPPTPWLDHQARRLSARIVAWNRGPGAAAPLLADLMTQMAARPARWEYAVTLVQAARVLPGRSGALRADARRVFEELGLVAEVRALDREAGLKGRPLGS